MGERSNRRVGDKLFLTNKLFDGEDSLPLRCFVTLRRGDTTVISTIELTHIGNGTFTESTEVMPDEDVIYADHIVLQNDGVTVDPNYSEDTDIYVKDLVGEIITTNLDAQVSTIEAGGSNQKNLEGVVAAETPIDGEINEETIEVTVSSDETLSGVITDE